MLIIAENQVSATAPLIQSLLAQQQDLTLQNQALRQKLADAKLISQAKRTLFRLRGMDEDAAHRFLQKESMNRRRPVVDLAKDILK